MANNVPTPSWIEVQARADSAAVVERLRSYRPVGMRTEYLIGNHEEVLLRILEGEGGLVADWLRFGGAECARSYGLSASRLGTC